MADETTPLTAPVSASDASLEARMYPNLAKPTDAPAFEIGASKATPSAKAPAAQSPAAPQPTMAERLYPDVNTQAPVAEAAVRPEAVQVSVEELINAEQSLAERMFAAGRPVPEAPEGYQHPLADGFDVLEADARESQNAEDIQALAAGRQEVAALMHELAVPKDAARELSRTLSDWHGRDAMTEDQRWDAKADTLDALQKEWGKEASARIKLAQQTAEEACKRLPWLNDLLRSGAGNDPTLIRRFAEIGLRNARRAKR